MEMKYLVSLGTNPWRLNIHPGDAPTAVHLHSCRHQSDKTTWKEKDWHIINWSHGIIFSIKTVINSMAGIYRKKSASHSLQCTFTFDAPNHFQRSCWVINCVWGYWKNNTARLSHSSFGYFYLTHPSSIVCRMWCLYGCSMSDIMKAIVENLREWIGKLSNCNLTILPHQSRSSADLRSWKLDSIELRWMLLTVR